MTNSDNSRELPWQPGQPVEPGVTRRRFLQYTALGSAAAATAAGAAAAPAAASVHGAPAAARVLPRGWSGTISDLKHVVILMQENRSFDHYFGKLRGVRGFGDKQILVYPNGHSIFQQPDPARTDLGYLLPYNLTDQTDGDLDHSWTGDHAARNGGAWNNWVPAKSEETMGYFTRNEIPFQYAVADAFTICDGYHQGIMAPTSPNRMYFWSGTSSGWITNPNDYQVDFGPDAGTPLVTPYAQQLQAAGVDWQVYTNNQVGDSGSFPDYFLGDFGDNPLWFYQQFNTTNSTQGGTGQLATRGAVTPWQTDAGAPPLSKTHAAYVLSSFIKDVKNNALPRVSWIVAPAGYCEHPSYTPDYGAHYVNTVLQTLFSNPELWRNTALFITYDEHDGFFDHQLPPFPEQSVTDEHIAGLPIGPGTRVPMLICSPWTRGGYVDSNVYDHTSMLRFLHSWTGVKPANVTSWRKSVTGDLTSAFDFRHPDFSIPRNIPTLDQTWALTQLTGGSTTPPAEGDQKMPAQEPGSRPHRPSVQHPFADVQVNRTTGHVTADLTNTGKVGVSFAVYPDAYLPFTPTPMTVLKGSPRSYTWDSTLTTGKYAFSVYGPDGFLTSFAGAVVPAGQNGGAVPVVHATPRRGGSVKLELELANEGHQEVVYSLAPNDYEGHAQTVKVGAGGRRTVSWPTDKYGYYDVVITAGDGFRRRYAGRLA
ncbi:MAG TPA: phospholipase C, phosphocholine-specific [Streptosporangiaceae bacterium]|jgi:phospholipase C|nr:phospholipase C, phosphocholine-specific [Streptosporangiaceae bacterium]